MKLILKGQACNFKRIDIEVTFVKRGFERGYSWILHPYSKQNILVSNDYLINLDRTPFIN